MKLDYTGNKTARENPLKNDVAKLKHSWVQTDTHTHTIATVGGIIQKQNRTQMLIDRSTVALMGVMCKHIDTNTHTPKKASTQNERMNVIKRL